MQDFPGQRADLLKVLAVSRAGVVIFITPQGEGYRAQYMSLGGVLLVENDLLLIKNMYKSTRSLSCERVCPKISAGSVFTLFDALKI